MPILNIHKVLQDKGMSNATLANLLNVSPQYVSEVVNGHRNITIQKVEEIAKTLGVPPAALFEGYTTTETHEVAKCPYCGRTIRLIKAK